MSLTLAKIHCNQIVDWSSFHDEFSKVFGFPSFYGRNMDAWIDCMTCLDEPEAEMTKIHSDEGKVITMELLNVKPFLTKYPEHYAAILECTGFVNWRRIEKGLQPVLALSYYA